MGKNGFFLKLTFHVRMKRLKHGVSLCSYNIPNRGLSVRMKECSPLAIYVHCYVKFGTARHHDNSETIAKYSKHNPESVRFS